METKKNMKTGPQDLKRKRDPPPRRSLREILQQGAGSSGTPLRDPVATSIPAVEISAKDRDEPVVRNLPEVKSGTLLLGVNTIAGGSTSNIPAGGGLGHLLFGVGGLCLAKKILSECATRKSKKAKARAREAGTWGIQQPGNADAPKQRETLTENLKRTISEDSTPSKKMPDLKRPWDYSRPETYKEVLSNIKIVIFMEAYPEDKLTEDDLNSILEELEGSCGNLLRELPHLNF
jgi:hypothetical protein